MYSRFGSKVIILEHGKRFLLREDEDIAKEVLKFLKAENIEIFTDVHVMNVAGKAGSITATVNMNGEAKAMSCSDVLVAAGITPNTDTLNLATCRCSNGQNDSPCPSH